jgi:hypothetical protein
VRLQLVNQHGAISQGIDLASDELRDRWDGARGWQRQAPWRATTLGAVQVEPAAPTHDHAIGDLDTVGQTSIRHLVQNRAALTLTFLKANEQHGCGVFLTKWRHHRGDSFADFLKWW